jgi:hypothetical protein
VIRSDHDTRSFRVIDLKEQKYKKEVIDATTALREGYRKLYTE